MARAGLRTRDEYLASLSSLISGLQNAPGRLLQSVEQSTQELDYGDVLDWYGLSFTTSDGPAGRWTPAIRSDATGAQKRHLDDWLRSSTR
jgi:hypothetical protein